MCVSFWILHKEYCLLELVKTWEKISLVFFFFLINEATAKTVGSSSHASIPFLWTLPSCKQRKSVESATVLFLRFLYIHEMRSDWVEECLPANSYPPRSYHAILFENRVFVTAIELRQSWMGFTQGQSNDGCLVSREKFEQMWRRPMWTWRQGTEGGGHRPSKAQDTGDPRSQGRPLLPPRAFGECGPANTLISHTSLQKHERTNFCHFKLSSPWESVTVAFAN